MKNIFKVFGLIFSASFALQACDDWTEVEANQIQNLLGSEKTAEYYENLRAYKKTKHQRAFGWFGFWNGGNSTSARGSLLSVPDSVDMISLWGQTWNYGAMTDEKRADLKIVQERNGTVVFGTVLLGRVGQYLPEDWKPEDETRRGRWVSYGKALAQMALDAGLNGLDIDYEPGIGGASTEGCPRGDDMLAFCEGAGSLLGPQSGTDKYLVVDGLFSFPSECDKYFNYFISQAYYCTSSRSLQSRFNALKNRIQPEQFIITEDFERSWKTGGYKYYDQETGEYIPSLLGMAKWKPEGLDCKGGCGTYHMEYEYPHNPEYKYLRQAIQIMNPANHNK